MSEEKDCNPPRTLKLAVLIVCFNRRERTLRALRSLMKQTSDFLVQPVLCDDGSTDGTLQAVLKEFPEVIIVKGNGQLYWNSGLHKAWTRAMQFDPDAFLWLNDDVELYPDALDSLAIAWSGLSVEGQKPDFILVGATHGQHGEITYSGYRQVFSPLAFRLELVCPRGELRQVDTFNGNIVLVPREIVKVLGPNDPFFFQGMGDIDYGLRALKKGLKSWLMPEPLGFCEANPAKSGGPFGGPGLTFRQRIKRANSHLGMPFRSWWRLTRRHSGVWFPLHFLVPYRRLFLFSFGQLGWKSRRDKDGY